MAQATETPSQTQSRPQSRAAVPSTLTLALWRIRRTWRLLLLAGIGILAAVTLVCTVPLYTQVALTAGLRGVLTATPQSAELALQGSGNALSPTIMQQETQSLNRLLHQQLGGYLQNTTEVFVQTQPLNISAPTIYFGDTLTLTGADMRQAARHVHLVRGRLPQPLSQTLEIAITETSAYYLHADVGSILKVDESFFGPENSRFVSTPVQIVGIISTVDPGDPFWHAQTFEPPCYPLCLQPPTGYYALMSNDTYLALLQQLADAQQSPDGIPFTPGTEPTVYWYYYLNASQIGIGQLDDLIARLQLAQTQVASGNFAVPSAISGAVVQTQLSGAALPGLFTSSSLERFRSRSSVVTIPVTLLLFQVVGLLLFFVSLMVGLLVERQAEVIALLRSRGASRGQVLGTFLTQSLGLALIALVVGPLLALFTADSLARATLAPGDQQALNILEGNPMQAALGVGWYALAAALLALLAMLLAIRGSASRDVLEMRREAARATRKPLWQRLYLDVIAMVIALTSFVASLYVANSGALDAQTNLLIAAPLALVAPVFLVIAGLLLFLRLFPLFLRWLSRLASRRAAAGPMLALAQMSRAPRQAMQMILLLALASSFASFALVFNASETQHLANQAAYQAGADFSGTPFFTNVTDSLAKQTAAYRAIPGVTSASLGFAGDASLEGSGEFSLRAVDASTFAQTAIWTDQDSSQPLSSLMQQLLARREVTSALLLVPAVVDALTWQKLNLSVGASFTLQLDNVAIQFVTVAEVEHIPTVNDSLVSGSASDFAPPGGVLVDYPTLAAAYEHASNNLLSINYVWLRTSDDPALLAKVRAALSKGNLSFLAVTLNDRRAILAALERDPLYLALVDVLTLGTAVTILLAVVGNLVASWLSARSRQINFAVLRALGSAPRQVASVLAWEQTIVYTLAIALGAVFGALLAGTIVPTLVFTGVPSYTTDISSGEFYTIQHVLPIQVVVPLALGAVFVALVLICAGAIVMMARVASRPSLGQTLRLNAD
jgi:putative ABC transport system permease protein